MVTTRIWKPAMAVVMLVAAAVVCAPPQPVAAECTSPWTSMPSFTKVAPTAKRVIVGTVISPDPPLPVEESEGLFASCVMRVDEVLRGPDPGETMLMHYVPTHAREFGPCHQQPQINARVGDQIAVAFDGWLPGLHRRGTVAAWIEGEPDGLFVPNAETLTLAQVRRAAAALPDTSASRETRQADWTPLLVALLAAVCIVLVMRPLGRRTEAPPADEHHP